MPLCEGVDGRSADRGLHTGIEQKKQLLAASSGLAKQNGTVLGLARHTVQGVLVQNRLVLACPKGSEDVYVRAVSMSFPRPSKRNATSTCLKVGLFQRIVSKFSNSWFEVPTRHHHQQPLNGWTGYTSKQNHDFYHKWRATRAV